MKKFIFAGVAFLLLGLFFITAISNKNAPLNQSPFLPTPTPVSNPALHQGSVSVSSFSPAPGAVVPSNQQIVISLDKNVSPQEVMFKIFPQIPFTTLIKDTQLIVTPNQPLSAGVTYTYSLQLSGQGNPTTSTFTVEGPTPVLSPNTFPSGAYEEENQYLRTNYPANFLKNQTPFSDSFFSISSFYKSGSPGHFAFTIVLKGDQTSSKNDFLTWLKSLGLTDSQIQGLDITYQ